MRHLVRIALVSPVAAALALGSAAVAQDHDGPDDAPQCAPAGVTPQLMTPLSGRLPRDASLVVGLFPGGAGHELPAGVQLSRRRRTVALRREEIAPGLFRLTPETHRLWGRYDLDGVAGTPRLLFARRPIPAPPSAPRLQRLERYIAASSGEEPHTEVRAQLGFTVPQGVVAILAYWSDDDEPDAWVRAVPTRESAVILSVANGCPQGPPGTTAPDEEGTVRLAFVDLFGQVSELSEPKPLP